MYNLKQFEELGDRSLIVWSKKDGWYFLTAKEYTHAVVVNKEVLKVAGFNNTKESHK